MLWTFVLCLLASFANAVAHKKDYAIKTPIRNADNEMVNDDYRPIKNKHYNRVYLSGCRDHPISPINGNLQCLKDRCHAQCRLNYQFPNGNNQLTIICHNDEWRVDGTEWTSLPHCEPICLPRCQNNGICINPNECQCPDNFSGPQCQYEVKPCLNFPPPVQNSRRHCNTKMCTVTCAKGFVFTDGSSIATSHCRDGNWVPSKSHWVTIPNCEPTCSPRCENGGVCLPLNICQCPQEFRGSQCQYSENECTTQKLGFNGGYNCTGDANSFSCILHCPPGVEFTFPPASKYICTYDKGVFQPFPIPQCNTMPDHQIVPIQTSKNSYIKITNHSWIIEGTSISKMSSQNKIENDISNYKNRLSNVGGFDDQYHTNNIPNGYYEKFSETTMTVEQRRPRSKICFTWGGIHYKTFDGVIYSFNSNCAHTLLQETQDGIFTIISQNSPGCQDNDGICYKILKIFLQGKEYILRLNDNGYPILNLANKILPIPGQFLGMRVQVAAHFIIVSLDAVGAIIKWDGGLLVQVKVSESLWNRTAGLCGRMNGDARDDITGRDYVHPKNIETFAFDWKVVNFDETCDEVPSINNACDISENLKQNAMVFCTELFSDKRFDACGNVVDLATLKITCQLDYCGCKDNDKRKCACNTMNVYVRQCYHEQIINSIAWQNTDDICPMTCSGGRIYKPCAPKTQPTCGDDMTISSANDHECEEGCVCPPGTAFHEQKCISIDQCPCILRGKLFKPGAIISKKCNTCTCSSGKWICTEILCSARCAAIGDPHYVTFDGKRYDFMGKCNYYMIKGDNYSVETENIACSGAISNAMGLVSTSPDTPSCTKSVTVRITNTTIKLKRHHQVLINGEEVAKLPIKISNTKIRIVSSIFIIIDMPNGLEIWWDGISRIYINAPAEFYGKTKGLCGTFTANQKDDFLTPMGDIEQSVIPFANKWKTTEQCNDIPVKEFHHTCDLNPDRYETAKKHCSKIWSETFSNCHWHVDPQSFYDDCMYDMCACETNIELCLCPTFAAYAKECAASDIKILWRLEIDICQLHCPNNQQYQICSNSCTRSCSDITFNQNCRQECVEGCNCPEGQTLDVHGECIPIGQCPCEYNGMEFIAGHREIRAGIKSQDLCTCAGGIWSCRTATSTEIKEYPAAAELKTICTDAKHLQITSCEPVEPRTCRNMHEKINQTPAKCRAGCICADGYVLDSPSGDCVKYEACPCYHGARSYRENATMQQNCNTCKCYNGKWNCTDRICPGICSAWGDSHLKTFDDKSFDFQGICDYVLVKGTFGNDDCFDISMQNVPCGSTGVTCSKSIVLTVGRGNNQEIVTLVRDQSLPNAAFKRIAIRKSGLFVFLDVPDLGLVVQWDEGTRVYVKLDPKWRGHTRGLCGDYNNNSEDDFKSPSGGISEALVHLFADTWKKNTYCPESKDIIDTCAIHPERKVWATEKCGILKSELFEPCHSEVDIVPFIQRCIFDTCGCDGGGDCECLCTALAAYAHECNIRGIPIRWRSQKLCPMQCDESCSTYTPCMSTCPQETCDNMITVYDGIHLCNQDACVEGCITKSCPIGQVYANNTFKECVLRATCKPMCLKIDGITYYEGDKISSDDCQTCYCSRSKVICNGAPCSKIVTEPITVPMEESEKCIDGWSSWFNRKLPKSIENNLESTFIDIEPLPIMLEMLTQTNSSRCTIDKMIDIRCRTVHGHKTPKETLSNVDCNLERGLYCNASGISAMPCEDFEISVLCRCADELSTSMPNKLNITISTVNEAICDVSHPNQEHPNNCHEFYQCVPAINSTELVKKTCGSNMMYNPKLQTCDWPHNVFIIRPECGTLTQPAITVAPERCNVGEHWDECAIKCSQTCQYYYYTLTEQNICTVDNNCIAGCVSDDRKICPLNKFWRDPLTCVEQADCPCKSHNGQMVKPGDVIKESSCERCQCLGNYYTCDESLCTKITTAAPIITSPVTNQFDMEKTFTTAAFENDYYTITVTSHVSPAVPCFSGQYRSLLTDNVTFNASTTAGNQFSAEMARLTSSQRIKVQGRYWKPKYMNTEQWIDINLPQLSPVYGITIQGTPIGDEYITSYRVLYSQSSDHIFSFVLENYKEKIFHGPIDSLTPMRQFFEKPIEARIIRVNPQTWHHDIALKVDLIGCEGYIGTNYDYESTTETITTTIPLTTIIHEVSNKNPICNDPMGLDSGMMGEEQVMASSTLNNLIPSLKLSSSGIWQPKLDNPNQYVQFDFLQTRNITGIETKGGDNIWTKTYKVYYGENNRNWNQMIDQNGVEKIFLSNFDDRTAKMNYFDEPVSARYLRIQPIKWHKHIGLKAEVYGCFIPYPENEKPPIKIQIFESSCNICHEMFQHTQDAKCQCNDNLWWDGEKCVEKQQCPCIVDQIPYAVGTIFEMGDCQKCMCAMGGAPVCQLKICDPCNEPNAQSVVTELCGCVCKPCPLKTKLCHTSNVCINESLWCNGIKDCPDDETNCEIENTAAANKANITSHTVIEITTVETKNVTQLQCEKPTCPAGYKLVPLKKSTMTEAAYHSSELRLNKKNVKGGRRNYGKGQQWQRLTKQPRQSDRKNVGSELYDIQCQQFSCTPEKPPPVFNDEMKTVKCPKVECPPNYRTVFKSISIYKPVPCPQYICKPPEPIEAICNVTGRIFNTFDNLEYKYDICNHILTREMYQNKWYITLEKHCNASHQPCSRILAITTDNDVVVLYPDMHVDINEYEFTPKQVNHLGDKYRSFKISRIGNIIHYVSRKYGFWVIWNESSNVKIGITTKLMNQVDGLCGYFDGNIDNDRQKADGSQAITSDDFGNSWMMDGSPECEQQTCSRYIFEQAHEICNGINDRSFAVCHNIIDMTKYVSRCLDTMCICINGNITKEECRCRALNAFAIDCQAADSNIDLSTWRNIHNCPIYCPAPFVYKDCYQNKCEVSCDNLQEIEPCPKMVGVCFSGCFCPDGTVRNGDNCISASECRDCVCNGFGNANFVNFDKKNFTFTGNCTYVLSRDVNEMRNNGVNNEHTYQILMTNVPCKFGICTEALSVIYKQHYFQIEQTAGSQSFLLTLDGEAIDEFPYKNSWMTLDRISDKDMTLLITAIQLEVRSYFHNFAFMIRLPSHIFAGAMEGLCGNCNANDEDDFKKLNGELTGNIDEFGMSWLARGLPHARFLNTEDCTINEPTKKCQAPAKINDTCAIILNTELFGQCHNLIDPAPFLNSCYETLCKNGYVCGDIEAYVRNCRQIGLCPDWRNNNLCPYTCSDNLKYQPCGPSCPDTCDTFNTIEKRECYQDLVEGCFCPENQVYHNGTCIIKQKCFLCDDAGHVDGDVWQPDKCTTCSCNKKIVNCQIIQCPILETVCQENFTPILVTGSEDECCPKYLCIPAPTLAPTCDEPQQPECGYGQVMKLTTGSDGCQKFICQCIPVEDCPIIAETIPELESIDLELGYVKIINTTGCCPRIMEVCKPEICPVPPLCLKYYNLKIIENPNRCCVSYECQPPTDICFYKSINNNNIENNTEILVKNIDAQWEDGTCTNCTCERSTDGMARASCVTTQCSQMDVDSEEFVLEEKILIDQCCPLVERVACKDNNIIYQVNQTWHANAMDACEIIKCVNETNSIQKKIIRKQCNDVCNEGYKYIESENKQIECCGECVAVACVINGSLRAIGEKWHSDDYCINYECLFDNGTIRVVESIERCDELDLHSTINYVMEMEKIPGECCPKFIKTGCRSAQNVYRPGDTWKNGTNNCITEICAMEGSRIELQRTIEICNKSCEFGWEYQEPIEEEQCCGRCVQAFCIADGVLHELGVSWISNDNCTTYECRNENDQLIITASVQTCLNVSHCPSSNIYNDGCCQHCNMTTHNLQKSCMAEVLELDTTIGIVSETHNEHGICRNSVPINGLTECHGTCDSSSHFNPVTWIQETDCQCCQPIDMKSIIVPLICEDAKILFKRISVPTTCSCNGCRASRYTKTGLNTPTKG